MRIPGAFDGVQCNSYEYNPVQIRLKYSTHQAHTYEHKATPCGQDTA